MHAFRDNNGSGEVTVSGGVGPYTYQRDAAASFQTTSKYTS